MDNLKFPNASSIQTGLTDIIYIIREKIPFEQEGDFLDLSEEIIQKPSAKFLDLFWFFNPNKSDIKTDEIQLDLVTLGINLNFGNLRINGYKDAGSVLHNQALFITKELLTINAAVYPTGVFHIRHLKNREQYKPIEQLFVQYNPKGESWHDELTRSSFLKRDDRLKMTLTRGDENYFFIFEERQYDLFNYALDYVLTNGFSIVGSKK